MNTTDRILGEAMTPYQKRKRIYLDAQKATTWALKHRQRFPEAEATIATDPVAAYSYARDVIKGRWPEAEPAIATNSFSAYEYAKDVIGGPWPEGEAAIATDPGYAYRYATEVIGGRWPEAEATIAKSQGNANRYAKEFPEAKFIFVMNGWIDWLDL